MIEWVQQLQEMLKTTNQLVIVTVASVKGSTPREPGARMLVSETNVSNTIGGGHLEYKAIQLARNMLSSNQSKNLQHFTLGAGLGQCCGGVVTLFFEVVSDKSYWVKEVGQLVSEQQNFVQVIPLGDESNSPRFIVTSNTVNRDYASNQSIISIAQAQLESSTACTIKRVDDIDYVFDRIKAPDFMIYLFGAGHVGEALVKLLAEQPCVVNWIDTRDGQLPEKTPTNVNAINTDIPQTIIDEAPTGSYFLVMTHDHSLDQILTEQILKRNDFHYLGLIGSMTKRKKFEHRLLRRGINVQQLSQMTCPIGISGIKSKRPAAIALAVMAELLQCYEQVMNNNKYNRHRSENKVSLQS